MALQRGRFISYQVYTVFQWYWQIFSLKQDRTTSPQGLGLGDFEMLENVDMKNSINSKIADTYNTDFELHENVFGISLKDLKP